MSPASQNALEIVAIIIGTAALAMGLMAWRIHRQQYPKEFRWPKDAKRSRRSQPRPR